MCPHFFLGSSAGDQQTTPDNDYDDFPPKILHFGLLPFLRRVPVFAGQLNKYHSITEGFSPIYLLFDLAESCRGGIYFFHNLWRFCTQQQFIQKSLEGIVYPPRIRPRSCSAGSLLDSPCVNFRLCIVHDAPTILACGSCTHAPLRSARETQPAELRAGCFARHALRRGVRAASCVHTWP